MKTNAIALRRHLDASAAQFTFLEAPHVQAACRAAAAPPDAVVVDARLPSWDLHVLRERFGDILVADAETLPSELAAVLEARLLPEGRRPTL